MPFAAIRGPRPREQARIDDGVCGDESLVAERALVSAGPRSLITAFGWPRSRAGGRGDGDERHRRPGVGQAGADPLEVVADARPGAEQAGDRLCRVQDAPPPTPTTTSTPRPGARRRPGRRRPATARRGPPPPRDRHAGGGEAREQLLAPAGRRQRATARDQQEPGAVRRGELRDARERPLAERDPRQPAERERGDRRQARHPGGVSGNRPTYRTPWRGSTKWFAVASRQAK